MLYIQGEGEGERWWALFYDGPLVSAATSDSALLTTWRALDTPFVGGADGLVRWRVSTKTESVSPSPNCFRIRKDTLWLSCADRRGRSQQTVDRWHTTLTRFSCFSSSLMVLPLDLATSPKPRAVILRGEGEGGQFVWDVTPPTRLTSA